MTPTKPNPNIRNYFDNDALGGIYSRIVESEAKFPLVAPNVLRATCVVVEEAGESMKAALDYTRGDKFQAVDLDQLILEVEQTAASCIRLLYERLYLIKELRNAKV